MVNIKTRGLGVVVATLCVAVSLALFGCGGEGTSSDESSATQPTEQVDINNAGKNAVAQKDAGKKTASTEDGRLDLLVLVNKEHKLPEGWEKNLDLVEVENFKNETVELDSIVYDAFTDLQEDLKKNEGITIELNSGYRSTAEQQRIWDELTQSEGEEYVQKYVAVPGYSEHQTGLVLDATLFENGEPVLTNEDMFARQDTWDIVHSYLAKHGFILRYLPDMEDITGYEYEPWHYRYVGKEAAEEIMGKNEYSRITLEEYLAQNGDVETDEAEEASESYE